MENIFNGIFSISIHAPTKGATGVTMLMIADYSNFNPRSHEGSDILGTSEIVEIYIFQSTLPRRERQSAIMANDVPMDISIHAPTKGATNTKPFLFNVSHISIHAPTKGATRNVRRCGRNTSDFNPRSHEGSDASSIKWIMQRLHFNPRSHEGSDVFDRKLED